MEEIQNPEILFQEAGYLDKPEEGISDAEIDRAYEHAVTNPKFRFGHRLKAKLNRDAKLFVIEMYEQATGKKLLVEKDKKRDD